MKQKASTSAMYDKTQHKYFSRLTVWMWMYVVVDVRGSGYSNDLAPYNIDVHVAQSWT